jgi:hypothetical protein
MGILMNNYQKMRETNHQAREKLKDMGYSDIVMFPHTRFSKDVWGLFDGVCKLKTLNSEMFDVYWFQIKTGHIKKAKKYIEDFCMRSGEKALIIERIPYKEKYKKKKGSYTKHKIRVTEID